MKPRVIEERGVKIIERAPPSPPDYELVEVYCPSGKEVAVGQKPGAVTRFFRRLFRF